MRTRLMIAMWATELVGISGCVGNPPPAPTGVSTSQTETQAKVIVAAPVPQPAPASTNSSGVPPAVEPSPPTVTLDSSSPSVATTRAEEKPDPTSGGRYEFRELHDPNGIGKFYLGREIAHVMGHQGISWLERPDREEEEGLSLLVEVLDLKPGQSVADIGAGSGVISLMLSEKVGPKGTVLAVDIQQEMLDALAVNCKQKNVTNILPVLGTTTSPNLKPGSVDLVIMVDVYHEFDMPYEMLSEIAKSLKTGGRVAFVEYRKEDPEVPIKEVHKMSEKQVQKEATAEELGLVWLETIAKLPRQHVVVFEKQ